MDLKIVLLLSCVAAIVECQFSNFHYSERRQLYDRPFRINNGNADDLHVYIQEDLKPVAYSQPQQQKINTNVPAQTLNNHKFTVVTINENNQFAHNSDIPPPLRGPTNQKDFERNPISNSQRKPDKGPASFQTQREPDRNLGAASQSKYERNPGFNPQRLQEGNPGFNSQRLPDRNPGFNPQRLQEGNSGFNSQRLPDKNPGFNPQRLQEGNPGFNSQRLPDRNPGFNPQRLQEGNSGFNSQRLPDKNPGFNPQRLPEGNSGFNPQRLPEGNSGFNPQRLPERNPQIKFENYEPVTEFAWNFFKNINNNKQDENSVVCPLSPQLLLSYIAYAATGETKKEIVDAIRYDGPSQLNTLTKAMLSNPGKKEIQLATAMFISDKLSLNPTFYQILENNAEIVPTDFTHVDGFNRKYRSWVEQKTKGALSNVRTSFHPSTKMVMSSAVYFKGNWLFKLHPGGLGNFNVNEAKSVRVNMMNLQKKMPYGKIQDYAEWIGLPYDSNETMVIVLPNKNVRLDDVIRKLNVVELLKSINIDNSYGNVTLTMPRFKVESRSSLINPLQQMGINRIFSPSAELPNLLQSNDQLAVSNVIQQASLEVNEQGSIATSLTSVAVVALSLAPPSPDVEFSVDRPFIAMIVDRNFNIPYFIAKITNPS